jgi:hypothetical protein
LQLSTYFKDTWDLGARGLSGCVEGSWRDEIAQENIQDCFELDEGDPGFQLLVFL